MSLSHLTALSAQTLSQILELQRFSTLPGSPSPPASLVTQIAKNMGALRTSILNMEVNPAGRDEVKPMREQWERMRSMVGNDVDIESLPPVRAPTPPALSPPRSPPPRNGGLDDGIYRPYKDEPADEDGPTHDEIMLEQRQMMDGKS
ncbi:hypothetical protein FS749_012891 [Ceratobasidium sp. UAMH 11750]|nr:hypothetical protein FS749_012891 [Ceratobasidium sp. UAMH 11750]